MKKYLLMICVLGFIGNSIANAGVSVLNNHVVSIETTIDEAK